MVLARWNYKAGIELTRYTPYEVPFVASEELQSKIDLCGSDHGIKLTARHEHELNMEKLKSAWHKKWKPVRQELSGNRLVHRVGMDPGCVEIPSVPLRGWKEAEKFFNDVSESLEAIGCLNFHEELSGAGGHIHVEMDVDHAFRLQKHMANQPWIMWAFAHPSDGGNCLLANRPFNWKPDSPEKWYYDAEEQHHVNNRSSKIPVTLTDYALVWRPEFRTTEFRLFDVAQTWDMQEEHLAFAQAFTRYAKKTKLPKHLMCREEVKLLSVEDAKRGFMQLIADLGLPAGRYEWYLHNIENRFEQGTSSFFN